MAKMALKLVVCECLFTIWEPPKNKGVIIEKWVLRVKKDMQWGASTYQL